MESLRSDEDILKAFAGLNTPPGSKRPRRESNEVADKRRAKLLGESNGWDANPIVKALDEDKHVFTSTVCIYTHTRARAHTHTHTHTHTRI